MHPDDLLPRTVMVVATAVGIVFLSTCIYLPPVVGPILTGVSGRASGPALVEEVEEIVEGREAS